MTATRRIGTTAALILSLAAAGAPGASVAAAQPNLDEQTLTATTAHPTPAALYSRQDKSMVPATSPSTTVGTTTKVSAEPPVVHVQAPANGFDWGDAGIGAAGGLALSLIGLGGALAVSQHRTRRNPA